MVSQSCVAKSLPCVNMISLRYLKTSLANDHAIKPIVVHLREEVDFVFL